LIQNGDLAVAGRILEKALPRFQRLHGKGGLQSLETGALLAVLKTRAGKIGEGRKLFAAFVPDLLKARSESRGGSNSVHDARLDFILNNYISVLLNGDDGEVPSRSVAESFRLADGLRGRKLASALASSAARGAVSDTALGDLVRREQDAETQIVALQEILTNLLASANSGQNSEATKVMRGRLDALQAARRTLLEEIRDGFPEYADLTRPKPSTLEEARQYLEADEALISTYTSADRTYIWVVTATGGGHVHVTSLGAEEMKDLVDSVREALDPGAIASLGDIPHVDFAAAHRLFAEILAPLRAHWGQTGRLIVIPHGALATLPLSLLPTEPVSRKPDSKLLFESYRDVPWLARSHAVTMLPSVGSLKALRTTRQRVAGKQPFIGFGDPFFSPAQAINAGKTELAEADATRGVLKLRSGPQTRSVDSATLALLPRLPDTAFELRSIAAAMQTDPAKTLFLGRRADEKIVKALDLTPYRVISFATHGLVTGDLDGLDEPALALTSPQVTGNTEDGLLTMSEILGLKLNAEWTVLSACNTAAAEGEGAEAVSGLGRAFFYAGTRAILVSNWPVHSGATAGLMTDLFQRQGRQPTLGRAIALQKTRLEMIDTGTQKDQQGQDLFSYAHPIFWAPFTLIGDGGGATP